MEEVDKGCPMIRMGVSGCFFWYRLTRVVPDQRPLNGCVCYLVLSHISSEFSIDAWQSASLDGPLVQSSQNCCRRESTVAWTLMKI